MRRDQREIDLATARETPLFGSHDGRTYGALVGARIAAVNAFHDREDARLAKWESTPAAVRDVGVERGRFDQARFDIDWLCAHVDRITTPTSELLRRRR